MIDTEKNVNTLTDFYLQIVSSAKQVLEILTALPGFRTMNIEHMDEILEAIFYSTDTYLAFTAVDTSGHVIAASRLPKGQDLSDVTHFRRSLDNRRFTVGSYIEGKLEDRHLIQGFASPIYDYDGNLIGSLGCSIRLMNLEESLSHLPLMEESIAMITDRYFTKIVRYPHSDIYPVGVKVSSQLIEAIKASPDGGFAVLDAPLPDGQKRQYIWKGIKLYPDGEYSFNIIFARNTKDADIEARNISIRNVVFILVAGIIGMIIVATSYRFLFGSRLEKIIEVTAELEAGSLTARYSNVYDRSDLGKIGQALDQLADSVQRKTIEMEAYAKQLVESLKVKDSLLREVHHRVKNNLQLIMSLLQLQKNSGSSPDESFISMEQRIEAMAMVHDMLNSDNDHVDLAYYTQQIINLVIRNLSYNLSRMPVLKSGTIFLSIDKTVPFGLMFNELFTQVMSLEAKSITEQPCEIKISLKENTILIEIRSTVFLRHNLSVFTGHFSFTITDALVEQLGGKIQFYNNTCQIEFPA